MTDPGLLTVLMPVLNEAANVEDAIRSVLRQADVDLELLVIDGGSCDGTREIVARLADADARVQLLVNERAIIPCALNIGLARARGELVARVDGHAEINVNYLSVAEQHLRRRPDVAAVGGRRDGVATTPVGGAIVLALSSRFGVGGSINHYLAQARDTDHASFGVYRTAVARSVGGWDEDLLVNEDVDFDHRILRRGHRIVYDPDMQILWRVRETIPGLFRQYRRYGRGKAAMVRKNGLAALRSSHLASPALVLATAASGVLVVLGRPLPAIALMAPYGVGLALASVRAARRRASGTPVQVTALPAAFLAMHVGWGLGFLEGLTLRLAPYQSSAPPPRTPKKTS